MDIKLAQSVSTKQSSVRFLKNHFENLFEDCTYIFRNDFFKLSTQAWQYQVHSIGNSKQSVNTNI